MFKLNLVTPEKKVAVDLEILFVTVPAFKGEVDILPGHTPFVTTLETGVLTYKAKGGDKIFKAVVSWGYCEVSPEGVNILADFIQTPEEIVVEESKKQLEANVKKLGTEVLSDEQFNIAQAEVARARAALDLTATKH